VLIWKSCNILVSFHSLWGTAFVFLKKIIKKKNYYMHPKIILSRIRFDLSYDNKFRQRENSEMVKKKEAK
jgi:hypothetical protein